MEESESELQVLRKSLQEEENTFTEEINKLRRKLDDEEHAKNSIERKVKGLEDEISDLKTSVRVKCSRGSQSGESYTTKCRS